VRGIEPRLATRARRRAWVDGLSRIWPAASPAWTVTVAKAARGDGDAPDTAVTSPAFDREADEATLIAAAVAGSREAFDVIVERHRRAVYNVCYRFAGTHEDASDLAQDVFVRAYRALGSFHGRAALSTWLYRIAVNVCLNRAAVKKPMLEALEPERHVDTRGEAPDAAVLRAERAAQVRRAIGRLPERQRLTVILRTYHDMTHEQIAQLLGSSVGTVKANFFHALRNLRGLLGTGDAS
jgi:RNA polymerase sigma-70 factor (ECF subfamily)